MGKAKEYSYFRLREICSHLIDTFKKLNVLDVCLSFPYEDSHGVDCVTLAEALVEGIAESLNINRYPLNEEWVKNLRIFFAEGEESFPEILLGVQTAKSIWDGRLAIRILTPHL